MIAVEQFRASGRKLEKGDLVRIRGMGSRIFRVRHLKQHGDREWLETYGPVDRFDVPKAKACYRSFPVDSIAAKVRKAVNGC